MRVTLLLPILVILFSGTCFAGNEKNIISGKYFIGEGVFGNAQELSKNGLIPEGTKWHYGNHVISRKEDFYLVFDLSFQHQISALLIQADHDDTYIIELSKDGLNWMMLWKVPSMYAGPGLPQRGIRTRTKIFPNPQNARYLRLRGEKSYGSDGRFSIARFKAYSSVPKNWPPELDYSIPHSRPPLFPLVDSRVDRIIKIVFTAFVLALLIWVAALRRKNIYCSNKKICKLLIFTILLLSAVAWPRYLSFHYSIFYHLHDHFHYYLGSKYIKELGYDRLYECIAIAEVEEGRIDQVVSRKIRNLSTNEVMSTKKIMLDKNRCRSHFDAAKWGEFKNDIKLFRGHTKDIMEWNGMQVDHGFNGTPVWIILGKLFATISEPSSAYISFLSFLDIMLLLVAGVIIHRSFGLEATFVTVSYFFLNGIATYGWTGGSFLRYDWLFMLALGVAALKSDRGKLAGFALTYSALLRLFPAIVLVAIALKASMDFLKEKSFGALSPYKDIAIGSAIALVLLVPLSTVVTGKKAWGEFVNNTVTMSASLTEKAGNSFGLEKMINQTARMLDKESEKSVKLDHVSENSDGSSSYIIAFRVVLTVVFLVIFIVALRKEKELWVVAVLSLGLVPFVATLMDYYYIMLSLFGLLWLRKPFVGFGLSMLAMASWVIDVGKHASPAKFAFIQAFVLLLIFAITTAFARERSKYDGSAGEHCS